MIKIEIIGNLGANAECKVVNGVNYTTFRIAHNRKWADKDGIMHEETIWVNCIGRHLEAVRPYLTAGKKVWIEGSPSIRVYQSSKDKAYYGSLDVTVSLLELLTPKADAVNSASAEIESTPVPGENPPASNIDNSNVNQEYLPF